MNIQEAIRVLDYGLIRLVDSMGSDLSIVRNARVSYDAAWRAGEDEGSDARLINYLYRNSHNTPFEAVTLSFEIKAPIFVIRQWHRHRTQSYSELSARYRPMPEEFYIPEPWLLGVQSTDNKQMRNVSSKEEYEALPDIDQTIARSTCVHMRAANEASFKAYKLMLNDGVPRELARSVLPVATYTHMFATMNLHNMFGFLRERLHNHAQYEIRVYAQAMLKLAETVAPVAVAAFKKSLTEKEGYTV